MLNVKDQVYQALAKVAEHVLDAFPVSDKDMPVIQYSEEENKVVEYSDMKEQKALCRYRIDIWDKTTTSELAVKVDEAISQLGLKRTQCMDNNMPGQPKHKILRYEMIIDVETQQVYHND